MAKKIDANPAYLSQIANEVIGQGRKSPRALSDDYASRLEKAFDLPYGWFDEIGDTGTNLDRLPPHLQPPPGATPISWDEENPLPNNGDEYWECPHYEVALSAGHGAEATWVHHAENDPLAFRAKWWRKKRLNPKDCRCLYVHGDSMSPYLEDWDTVMIDVTKTTIRDGEIYALLLDGELYIKRLYRVPGGGLEIRSDNPAYRTVELRGADLERLVILGQKVHRSG
jgi:phage repressor protein C with HTH and peptisase S24 domain